MSHVAVQGLRSRGLGQKTLTDLLYFKTSLVNEALRKAKETFDTKDCYEMNLSIAPSLASLSQQKKLAGPQGRYK